MFYRNHYKQGQYGITSKIRYELLKTVFNRRGLYHMKQFYETYKKDEFVSALLTQIHWTNHLLIMSKSKSKEERDFYINLCMKAFIMIHIYAGSNNFYRQDMRVSM